MGKKLSEPIKNFLEKPANSKFSFWLVGLHSLVGCVLLAAYGFTKSGIGAAVVYGVGGWLWGAVQGIVFIATFWLLLRLVTHLLWGDSGS